MKQRVWKEETDIASDFVNFNFNKLFQNDIKGEIDVFISKENLRIKKVHLLSSNH